MGDNYIKNLDLKEQRIEKKELIEQLLGEYKKYLKKFDLEDLKELEDSGSFEFGARK